MLGATSRLPSSIAFRQRPETPYGAAAPRTYLFGVSTYVSLGDELIEFACLTFQSDDSLRRRRRAERLARDHAGAARANFLAAGVLGDVTAVERGLAVDPGLATRAGGPRGWTPLLYLCFG